MNSVFRQPGFPPAPWRLKGDALLQLQLLPMSLARRYVPPELGIVRVGPGTTLGGLMLATYRAGSTLQYHELIIVAGLVRKGVRIGAWISHIYVDDPLSVEGGRQIWALPKQLASFEQCDDGSTRVRQDEHLLCVVMPGYSRGRARLPVYASVLSQRNGRVLGFGGYGTARLATMRGEIELPPSSPFSSFGFGRGRRVVLQELDLKLQAPAAR